jgi:hypothetical protein
MCCPLNRVAGKLTIQAVALEEIDDPKETIYHLQGIYNRTPPSLSDRAFRFFQWVELIEKIAEIADESFHLLGTVLQRFTSILVYQTLNNVHHASHDIEHILHSFCFLGDLSSLIAGKFFVYDDEKQKQFDYLRSAARVCHTMSHFLAFTTFLSEHKLGRFGVLEKLFKYAPVFNALGYALWTTTLIWRRYQGKSNDQFFSDLGIHMGGCLFETLPLTKSINTMAPYGHIINKMAAVAGIIHAWFVVQRLIPPDCEEVTCQFVMPENDVLGDSPDDHHHHAHNHQHALHFHRLSTP